FSGDVAYYRTVGNTSTSFDWSFMAAGPGDFTLPTLPAEVGDVNPKAGDNVSFPYGSYGIIVEADTIKSYDDVRKAGFRGTQGCGAILPSDYTFLRFSASQCNKD